MDYKQINKKLFNNFILALLIFNIYIGVDFYQQIFFDNLRIIPDIQFIFIIAVFSLFCSFLPNIPFILITLLLFSIELTEYINFAYFGDFISPNAIGLIIDELEEIITSGSSAFKYIYKIVIIPLLLFITMLIFLISIKHNRLFSKWALIPILIILSITPIKVIKNSNFSIFYPDQTMHSMRNGIYAFSGYFFKIFPQKFYNHKITHEYKKYEIEKISDPQDTNVILVIGESVNHEHMSIYGYKRKTNPELEKLIDEGIIFKKSISSSTSTKISLPLILNSIREPNNEIMLLSKGANLFKLAKENGFKTIYISAQESVLSRAIGANYIDEMIVFENKKELFEKHKDEALIKILEGIEKSDKNFIVLHQRNSHSPYEGNYSHRNEFKHFSEQVKDYKNYAINTYDNSILFNDFVLKNMIDYFKNSRPNFSFFFTSDHGEMLGENGLFGHVNFDINATKIPFLYYSNIKDNDFIESIPENITHYEMSLLIAKKLGFKIKNPNIGNKESFFIHGNNHNNVYEVLDYYEVMKNSNEVEYIYKQLKD